MRGDFSRLTFDPSKQYTKVLMQQGRVQLDADWNEQADILLHYLRSLAADLIGPFGGPEADLGFQIRLKQDSGRLADLEIGSGRYYVDGLMCENREERASYFAQPYLKLDRDDDDNQLQPSLLVYLDVWERHITHLHDDRIREVALGGPDTATRTQVAWQVRVQKSTLRSVPVNSVERKTWFNEFAPHWLELVSSWQPEEHRGRLKAKAKPGGDPTDPCEASPEARFRGTENQLYRVEIQWQEPAFGRTTALSFKWSRENGSVVFPVRDIDGATVKLESLGRDEASGLKEGDCVEFVDDETEFAGTGPLLRVEEVDTARRTVKLEPQAGSAPLPTTAGSHALLRRWDHQPSNPRAGAVPYRFASASGGSTDEDWLDLEDGIRIQFQPGVYRAGDYWLIPARTATGDVEWLGEPDSPEALLPHGVRHHFAPLAFIEPAKLTDLRNHFAPLASRANP